MRCKNCNIEITEYEIFCDDCKKELKKVSSRSDVKELEKLIEEQKKLNDLEQTKELVDLDKLVKEELKDEGVENTSIIDSNTLEKEELFREKRNKKNNNKKLIIIIVSIAILIITLITTLFILNNKDSEKNEPAIIDYNKVINEYGNSISKIVSDLITLNEEVPTWQQIIELLEYKKHEVVCEIHEIYSDGSIYLDTCKVDSISIKFSFGEKKEEIKEGKNIEIYKLSYENGFNSYFDYQERGSNIVGKVTCKNLECSFISGYNKYVIIKEEKKYYLYNYETNTLEFGPFDIEDENVLVKNILSNNDTIYGIFYTENGINNIYSLSASKILKNIKGSIVLPQLSFDPSMIYRYNYVLIKNNEKTDFVNLKTGNVSFKISDNISTFIEDITNKMVYIITYKETPNKFKIYNSNGKLLFDGKEYTKFKLFNGDIIVANEQSFKVYDSDLKIKISSKGYDKLLEIYDDYVVVISDNYLQILNLKDEVVAKFDSEWNKDYYFHSDLSGIKNNVLNLIVENKKIPSGLNGNSLKYYYIPSTNEIGIIESESIY